MALIPTIPNNTFPLTDEGGLITQAWQLFFSMLSANSNQSGSVQVFAGVAAPKGWTVVTVAGMPILPGGFIWIRKS